MRMEQEMQTQKLWGIFTRSSRAAFLGVAAALVFAYGSAFGYTDVTLEEARERTILGLRQAILAMQLTVNIHAEQELIVVDVREPSEFCGSSGHIPGAVNYPWNSNVLQARYNELPKTVDILVI